jgi:hypothetical protein
MCWGLLLTIWVLSSVTKTENNDRSAEIIKKIRYEHVKFQDINGYTFEVEGTGHQITPFTWVTIWLGLSMKLLQSLWIIVNSSSFFGLVDVEVCLLFFSFLYNVYLL